MSGGYLPLAVREVLREHPGISLPRAHEIVADRKRMRRLAALQAQRNLYGALEAGGIGASAKRTIAAIEGAY